MILGVIEHLGDGLPLDVVGMSVEPAPKVCSGHKFRLEGTHASSWAGVPASLDLRGLSYSGCWGRCCALICVPGHARVPG